jgi:hypothetical protein
MNYYDTIRIDRDRVRIRLVRLPGDSIFVQAECKDTTIRYVKTFVSNKVTIRPWWLWWLVLAAFLLGFIIRNRLPI